MNYPEESTNNLQELSALIAKANPEIQDKIKLFNMSIKSLLDAKEYQTYSIIPTIKRYLIQFSLDQDYEPNDIFQEAYIRGLKKIIKLEDIPCIPAWIKLTSLNIIREKCRDKEKQKQLINRLQKHEIESKNLGMDYSIYSRNENYINILHLAIQSLDKKDSTILKLHIVDGLSWRQIGEHFVSIGEEVSNNDALIIRLRKRGQRALDRLRQNYYSLLQTKDYKSNEG